MQGNGGSRLVVRRGPQPNQAYELNKDIVALGRDITNDIVINDPEVSRHHCRLSRTSTGYTFEDLGSTNGSFINGQRLTATRPMMNGDMIGLGETVTLVFEGGAVQPPVSPAQAETMIGATGEPQPASYQPAEPAPAQSPYAPPPAQQPYGAPQYSAPAQPYAEQQVGYEYYEYEQEQGSKTGRWIALGCGCLVILCILTVGLIGFIIDAFNLWCSVPLMPDLFNLNCLADLSAVVPHLLTLLV
ncbi:FHA domain-containing protein [Chloroflexota bacterium]